MTQQEPLTAAELYASAGRWRNTASISKHINNNKKHTTMKKLLVIPIMVAYYLLVAVPFLIQLLLIFVGRTAEWMQSLADQLSIYLEDYLMKPAARIQSYALKIMQSDKILQHINEASEKLKQGKPID